MVSNTRKGISKKSRFEIFKRDGFKCQYCGSAPPSVVLEIDHISPVSHGGDNSQGNIITACFDCNRGKAARSLTDIPQSLADKADTIREKREQLQGYEEILLAEKKAKTKDVNKVQKAFREDFPGYSFNPKTKDSIRMFLDHFMASDLIQFMRIATSRMREPEDSFKYFYGICWRRIKARARDD